jgi:hypothetical protein
MIGPIAIDQGECYERDVFVDVVQRPLDYALLLQKPVEKQEVECMQSADLPSKFLQ